MILDSEEIKSSRLLRLGLRHCALLGSSLGEWWSRESSLIKFAVQEDTLQLDELEELPSGAKIMISAHLQAPRHQRAPARFLALVHTWRHLRDTWSKDVEEKLRSLEAGIGKLREAGEQVAKLEDEVSRQRQELEVTSHILTLKNVYLEIFYNIVIFYDKILLQTQGRERESQRCSRANHGYDERRD